MEVTASVDHVGVITEDTMTALASIGLDDGIAANVVAGADVTDVVVVGRGVGFGGVVTVGAVGLG